MSNQLNYTRFRLVEKTKHKDVWVTDSGKLFYNLGSYFYSKPTIVNNMGYERSFITYNKRIKHELVHRLVALHFIKKIKGKNIVNHIDGDKLNNHYTNLEWCTQKENMQHAISIGINFGTKSKLTNSQKLEILKKYDGRWGSKTKLSIEYGVSSTTISKIISNTKD